MMILLLLISLNFSWAGEFQAYRIGSLTVVFHKVDGLWVNKSCENSKCQALATGKKEMNSEISSDLLAGGKNPFAVRCKTVMGGKVLIALDKAGNQQSLCQFPDDSFLK
jgi:hypothetical protein